MISVKHFIEAVHRAVAEAADVMEERNKALLEQYFEHRTDGDGGDRLVARTVLMSVPDTDEDGNKVERNVEVPLVSLIPLSASRIEKATFSVHFRMSVKDDELSIAFPGEKIFTPTASHGHLDIVISPGEPAEGLQQVIDYYTDMLKRQL